MNMNSADSIAYIIIKSGIEDEIVKMLIFAAASDKASFDLVFDLIQNIPNTFKIAEYVLNLPASAPIRKLVLKHCNRNNRLAV